MLSKKSKENPILMEARKVLLNHVTINENDRFVTVDEFRFQMWGAADGESNLRFWGIAHREHIYESKMDNKKVLYRARKRMTTMGRGIDFKCDPNAAGCIVRTYVFYPVVLALHGTEEGQLELEAFTPRWLTAGLAIAIVVRKFEKVMKDLAERSETDEKTSIEKFHSFISEKKENFKKKKEEKKQKKTEKKKKKFHKKKDDERLAREIERAKLRAAGVEVEDSDEDDELAEVLSMDWGSDSDTTDEE